MPQFHHTGKPFTFIALSPGLHTPVTKPHYNGHVYIFNHTAQDPYLNCVVRITIMCNPAHDISPKGIENERHHGKHGT